MESELINAIALVLLKYAEALNKYTEFVRSHEFLERRRPVEVQQKRHRRGGRTSERSSNGRAKVKPQAHGSPSFLRPCSINIRETRMQYTTRRDSRARGYFGSSRSTNLSKWLIAIKEIGMLIRANAVNQWLIFDSGCPRRSSRLH